MSELAKLTELAETSSLIKEFDDFNILADRAFKLLRRKRMELSKIKDHNKSDIRDSFRNKTYVIPDMKILIVDGVPKIYSRYPN